MAKTFGFGASSASTNGGIPEEKRADGFLNAELPGSDGKPFQIGAIVVRKADQGVEFFEMLESSPEEACRWIAENVKFTYRNAQGVKRTIALPSFAKK